MINHILLITKQHTCGLMMILSRVCLFHMTKEMQPLCLMREETGEQSVV